MSELEFSLNSMIEHITRGEPIDYPPNWVISPTMYSGHTKETILAAYPDLHDVPPPGVLSPTVPLRLAPKLP